MPSPFPGLDPYLEVHWRDLHAAMLVYAGDQLHQVLPAELAARIADRPNAPIRHLRILDASAGETITVIEFLTPTDRSLFRGRQLYQQQRSHWLNADVNLLENDLLRIGERDWLEAWPGAKIPEGDLLISSHRASRRSEFQLWPTNLRQALPTVPIPLRSTDDDIPLDLQQLITQCYDRGRYGATIDYSTDPSPPLSAADARWADELLRSAGKRS